MGHTCRGTINLATANIAVEDSCNFVISNGGAQTYHLKANSEVERQRWITALELAKAKAVRMQAESGEREHRYVKECRRQNICRKDKIAQTAAQKPNPLLLILRSFPLSLFQMTRVMIVLQFPPPQDRVEAAVTQKSSPHCEHSTARWRTSPPVTISLSSMVLPSKGIGYQTEFLCKTVSSREKKGEGYLFILFAHTQVFVRTGRDSCRRGHGGEDQTSHREGHAVQNHLECHDQCRSPYYLLADDCATLLLTPLLKSNSCFFTLPKACRDFLSLAQNHSKRWQKALHGERDQRIRLEETLEQLAKQHNHLERAFRGATVLPSSFSNPALGNKGKALIPACASVFKPLVLLKSMAAMTSTCTNCPSVSLHPRWCVGER